MGELGMIEFYVVTASLFGVIVLLFKHLSYERKERHDMMERYQQMAWQGQQYVPHPSYYGAEQSHGEPSDPLAYADPVSAAEVEGR